MKICILTRIMPAHSLGGMQQHTQMLAEGLPILRRIILNFIERTKPRKDGEIWPTDFVELMRKSGHKVHVFCSRE